jgi:hypothetical protein
MRNDLLTVTGLVCLSACSVSPVRPVDGDRYTVTAQNAVGMSSGPRESRRAIARADAFCRKQDRGALLTSRTETGVTALSPLQGTVEFRCVDRRDPAYLHQQQELSATP